MGENLVSGRTALPVRLRLPGPVLHASRLRPLPGDVDGRWPCWGGAAVVPGGGESHAHTGIEDVLPRIRYSLPRRVPRSGGLLRADGDLVLKSNR